MSRWIDFPTLAMLAAVAIAVPSILMGNQAGLGFAAGLTSAAGTAYQYQQKRADFEDDPRKF
ncbi:hypothetical protein [Synechocystis sp. LKSZ1]|uniref:hypothetical protein n=1 Tax=Synechocystis sp. LKSZ1 TaxID=3144951 RepID=UPI00336BC365